MTVRIPLVVVNGQVQQLQTGDSISVSSTSSIQLSLTNNEAATINICQPVYIDAANGVKLAKADAATTAKFFALVGDATIAAASAGNFYVEGILTATTTQWDAVTGDVGGLTAGDIYYLDAATAGKITKTAPTTVSQYIVRIGRAINTTDLEIDHNLSILL